MGDEKKSELENEEKVREIRGKNVQSYVQGEVGLAEDEIDLFELAGIIWKRRKLIFLITISATFLGLLVSFIMTPRYKATAKIIPITSQKSFVLPFATSEFANLAGLLGVNLPSGSNTLRAVLESRDLAKRVIKKTGIEKYLYGKLWDEKTNSIKKGVDPRKIPSDDELAEKFIKSFLKINEDKKTGVIEISIIFPKEPTLSALIANEYVSELSDVLNEKAYTISKKNRIFIEERVKLAEKNLQEAEKEFKEFQEKYNVVAIDKQMEEGLKIYAELVAQLAEKEMKLEVLRKITTRDNPEVVTLMYEINELKNKIRELEGGQKNFKGYILDTSKRLLIPLESVPEVAMEYLRRRRNFEIQNQIYKTLLQALEQARIEEEKEDITFEIIDYAYPPKYRYSPKRKLIVAVSFTSAMFLGVFLAFLLEAIENRRKEQS
ncbi:Tyrosine-protein kinase ptk [bacterium HR19]|nr:Tyrosine-protein kinase ptk [bacterium HR19]